MSICHLATEEAGPDLVSPPPLSVAISQPAVELLSCNSETTIIGRGSLELPDEEENAGV